MTSWKPSAVCASALVATWGSAVPMGKSPCRGGYGRKRPTGAALTEVKRLKCQPLMTGLASHPQKNSVRLQLRQNQSLAGMTAAQWSELEPLLAIADYRKGDPLVRQGDE